MGLDLYVGSLARYTLGDWLTVVQQAGVASGMPVQVVRSAPEPEDAISDPAVIGQAVQQWRDGLGVALGVACDWPETADAPYWTDKPDWDGYGAVVLMAAYDERPDLKPRKGGLLRRGAEKDSPTRFPDSPAFKAASASPARYPSLLGGAEWWLPIAARGPWQAPRLTGQPTVMASVESLVLELRTLEERTGLLKERSADAVRREGAVAPDAPVEDAAAFGLAIFSELAALAAQHRQPLLMDY
jgi:hypothetical protein